MSNQQINSFASVSEIFDQEIATRSGKVLGVFQDETRLFARSVLPSVAEVLPEDRLQGGVALRATESDIWLSPYIFRQVCSNGAIMAHTLQTQHLSTLDWEDTTVAACTLREAIRACCEPEAFATSVEEFRSATRVSADHALSLLALLHQSGLSDTNLYREIMDQFFREADRTRFGLTNAVTAVARETRDPEVRWRLEELGGAIAAGQVPPSPKRGLRMIPKLRLSLAEASEWCELRSAALGASISHDDLEDASDEFVGVGDLASQFG